MIFNTHLLWGPHLYSTLALNRSSINITSLSLSDEIIMSHAWGTGWEGEGRGTKPMREGNPLPS